MRKWIDFVSLLLLSSLGVIASFLAKRNVPIPDDITLLLFGTGIISSVFLIRTELPFDEEQVRNHSDTVRFGCNSFNSIVNYPMQKGIREARE